MQFRAIKAKVKGGVRVYGAQPSVTTAERRELASALGVGWAFDAASAGKRLQKVR